MEEEMLDQEMAGIAAPTEELPMGEAESIEAPMEEPMDAPISLENMVSNYEAMDPEKQQFATVLVDPTVASYIDELLGQPLMTEFAQNIAPAEPPVDAPAPEGMMAPTDAPMNEEPMADLPMEDEEATSPV